MIEHGPGWRIEEWHYAVAVPTSSMGNPSIFCQTASQIARMHKLHRRPDFPQELRHMETKNDDGTCRVRNATLDRLDGWGEEALKVKFDDTKQQEVRIFVHILANSKPKAKGSD